MKKETMKQTYDGYEYKGFRIRKRVNYFYGSKEVSWLVDDKIFLLLKEARAYIDKIKEGA